MALNILKGFQFTHRDAPETFHRQIEAIKLAFADAFRYIADPCFADVPVAALFSDDYAAERRALIGDRAAVPEAGKPESSDIVYLCAADGDDTMVSFIQSNYKAFGCGGVMGYYMQPQGQTQVLMNMINFHLNPQQVISAPRWQ